MIKRLSRRLGLMVMPFLFIFFILFLMVAGKNTNQMGGMAGNNGTYNGVYTEELPLFPDIKGTGNFSDEVVQLAMGTAVKYRLLPSVILSQWAYESAWGKSLTAENDKNYFGITWFEGCPFPQGNPRGIGGSEGGYYMRFPNDMACFSYYGHMIASQSNFNASVGNTSPGGVLLILGRGGYAAAGITESSPYYTNCLSIIDSNNLTQYDEFAIKNWQSFGGSDDVETIGGTWGWPFLPIGQGSFTSGQLFGTNAGGGFRPNGFHDGLDFGSVDHPGNEVRAVHSGTVIYVGNPGITGLGACVIVIKDGDLSMVYQEFATSSSNSRVSVGDKVKTGQVIGIRDTDHLHLGFTKKDWLTAQSSAFVDDGTWLDPMPYLTGKGN